MKKCIGLTIIGAAILSAVLLRSCTTVTEQHTFYSQFNRSDSLQVEEIWSPDGNSFRTSGHHGPAVENQYMALRIYFDARGAIDVYSKSGLLDNELGRWQWYPSVEQQETEGAGCDEYYVGRTMGLGGVRLWDGEQEIHLETTAGRRSLVGRTERGAFMEMTAYGVVCQEDTVDVSLRVDVSDQSRWATVTVRELGGKPIRFATGVNYHPGEQIRQDVGWIAVWGKHPADVSTSPMQIGAAIRYNPEQFPRVEDTGSAIRLVSLPLSTFTTHIVAASEKEAELSDPDRFFSFVSASFLN